MYNVHSLAWTKSGKINTVDVFCLASTGDERPIQNRRQHASSPKRKGDGIVVGGCGVGYALEWKLSGEAGRGRKMGEGER